MALYSSAKRPEFLAREICRELGISATTFYNWKSKYDGMEASDVKRLKDLDEENTRLKKNVRQPSNGQPDTNSNRYSIK